MALKGKNVVINVSTDDIDYYQVAELNDGTLTIDGDNIDVTEFGDDFINRIQGLKDGTYSLSGFRDPDDTDGQEAINSALLNDTSLYVQFLADGTTGFQQEVKVSTFETSAAVDGAVEISVDMEGSGSITAVT